MIKKKKREPCKVVSSTEFVSFFFLELRTPEKKAEQDFFLRLPARA
jgi:hypothetical protein